jgi:hypothetical protein
MTTLVANVPPVKVWVRKEYLYDLQKDMESTHQGTGSAVNHSLDEHYISKRTLLTMARYMTSFLLAHFLSGIQIIRMHHRRHPLI